MNAHTRRFLDRRFWLLLAILATAWGSVAVADEFPPAGEDTRAAVRDAVGADELVSATPVYQDTFYRTRRTRWDVGVEGGMSLFEDASGILGEPVPAGVTPFQWGLNEAGSAFGFRVTIGYRPNGRNRIEARGNYWGSWDDSTRQTGQFGFRPAPGGALILSPPGASATLTTETDMWGGELNWWRQLNCSDCWELNAGLGIRYLMIEDEVQADSWVGLAPDSFLSGEVENAFLGAQLLGSVRWFPSRKVEFLVSAKALLGSMMYDMEESDTSIVTGGATQNARREDSNFAWGVEGEVGVLYRLSRRVGVSAAYTILFLDEVARASTVLDLSRAATGSVQLSGQTDTAVVHSFFVGFRIDV